MQEPPASDGGLRAAERFLERLVALAARNPLTVDDLRRAFAAFSAEGAVFEDMAAGQRKAAPSASARRTHAFERALVNRFEARFSLEGEGRLSRRVIIGLTFALTKLLTPEGFRRHELAARRIAEGVADKAALRDNEEIRLIVDAALVDLARGFDDGFLDRLKSFAVLVNSRLGAPRPGAWDGAWELTRPLAVAMLDDMYAGLRAQLDRGALPPAHGPDAAAVLSRFFAGLDGARRLADRPWLRRPLSARGTG